MGLKYWFEYTSDWRHAPMAYWVHVPLDAKDWRDESAKFQPPAPREISGKGYPVLCVEVKDEVLWFSSGAQLRAFIETLWQKPLPSTRRLSELRGTGHGPNSHWLSRLPAWMKSPAFRDKTLPRLEALLPTVAEEARRVGWS